MMMRLMDFLKNGGITAVFISLTVGVQELECFVPHGHLDSFA
jgi:hypothetical protein